MALWRSDRATPGQSFRRGRDRLPRTPKGTPPRLGGILALHLYRATWATPTDGFGAAHLATSDAALRLFISTATELLDRTEPLLNDHLVLTREVMDLGYVFTYPAVCSRLVETFSLLALVEPPEEIRDRTTAAVVTLTSDHAGTARPPSDQFAAGILPAALVLARTDNRAARAFLRKVSQWLLDCHDKTRDGLGLGAIDEDERTQFERLVAGKTTMTALKMRCSSYLASVTLDALWVIGAQELYEAVRKNMSALRIVAIGSRADERQVCWRRGGPNVHLHPRVDYPAWADRTTNATPAIGTALVLQP